MLNSEFGMRNSELFYTKHHLKFRKNQADNLVAVFNRFICDSGTDFSFILLVFILNTN